MSLPKEFSRILIAEDADGKILGFSVIQMMPHVGPMYVAPSERGSGLAEELADKTLDYLKSEQARGWLVVAEHPSTQKLCLDRGMNRLPFPVFTTETIIEEK
jgi:L-amino acid N-acyltransferase YncA